MTEPLGEEHPDLASFDLAVTLNMEMADGYKRLIDEYVDKMLRGEGPPAEKLGIMEALSCPLCGQKMAGHDQAACDAKMAAWRPIGFLSEMDLIEKLGIPLGLRPEDVQEQQRPEESG